MNISYLFNLETWFCIVNFVKVSSFLCIQFSTWSIPAELIITLTVKLTKLLQQISERQEMSDLTFCSGYFRINRSASQMSIHAWTGKAIIMKIRVKRSGALPGLEVFSEKTCFSWSRSHRKNWPLEQGKWLLQRPGINSWAQDAFWSLLFTHFLQVNEIQQNQELENTTLTVS